MKNIASMLDCANHHSNVTHELVHKMCQEVVRYQFNALFVNPLYVLYAQQQLHNLASFGVPAGTESRTSLFGVPSGTESRRGLFGVPSGTESRRGLFGVPTGTESRRGSKVGSVIAFPLGQEAEEIRVASIKQAAHAGAHELDISLNVGAIKEAAWAQLLGEMIGSISSARSINPDIIIKFIPETGYLTSYEIQKVAELMVQAGADFFKTCSGMGPRGATVKDVQLIRQAVGHDIKIKVAGGIADYETACMFVEAGVDRIGTSHAVEIVQGIS